MADAFISYTKSERALTQALAKALQAAGLTVWWDTELLAGDGFRAEIDAQLDACSAVIIVWSTKSAASYWVMSEADHALRQGKLINVHHDNIRPENLPKPFGQVHAVPVTDTDNIIKAVKHLRSGTAKSGVSVSESSATLFVNEALEDALKNARRLSKLARRENWRDDALYAENLRKLAENVHTPLRMFRERLPFPEIVTYGGRRLVDQLDEATSYAYRQISKELSWLRDHGSKETVLTGARGDLAAAADDLLENVELPA